MKKFKLKVLFGTDACNYAEEFSEKGAIRKIHKGDVYGSVGTYTFDTEEDLKTAMKILEDFDGWMDYLICEE